MSNSHVIFKENNVSLSIGDKLELVAPENEEGFIRSAIGVLFKEGKCDKAYIEVKQKLWLEVFFELTLEIKGKPVTNLDMDKDFSNEDLQNLDLTNAQDRESYEYYTSAFEESADYTFLRYILNKGARRIS